MGYHQVMHGLAASIVPGSRASHDGTLNHGMIKCVLPGGWAGLPLSLPASRDDPVLDTRDGGHLKCFISVPFESWKAVWL